MIRNCLHVALMSPAATVTETSFTHMRITRNLEFLQELGFLQSYV